MAELLEDSGPVVNDLRGAANAALESEPLDVEVDEDELDRITFLPRGRKVSPRPVSVLRPLSAGIAALVVAAERLHGQIGRRRL